MQRRNPPRTAGGIILTLGLCVACLGADDREQKPPAAAEIDPVVDRILTSIEQREVRELRAKIVWELTYAVEEEEDSDRKFGTIWYKHGSLSARFKVHFDTKIVGSTRRKLDEQHLFDGRWYTELQSRTKTITRREIRRADDTGDPYKLGEGPFPLPFGQKKADILAEFEVSHVAAKKSDPPETDHLRLKPRPDTNTGRTYKTVDFWVARAGDIKGLPVKVVAGKKDGTGAVNSYITITFRDVRLNAGFDEGVFKIETPSGYESIVERLEPIGASTTIKGKSPE